MGRTLLVISLLFMFSFAFSQIIPSSPRSRQAIKRVRPRLEREINQEGFHWGAPIFIRIFKESRTLEMWLENGNQYTLFKTYEICTYGWRDLGPKLQQGDGRAPEGFYFVRPGQLNPYSRFHLSFNIGYPNRYDRLHHRTGGAIMVHGSCVSIGCFAMTDSLIEEIYALADAALRNGQPFFRVHIFPFRMTKENMERYRNSRWIEFWQNLKEGYDYFERRHAPPNVVVRNGRYVFE
ncbi:L,D-transpeptidase family protein [Calditrichota bacterium LG25]